MPHLPGFELRRSNRPSGTARAVTWGRAAERLRPREHRIVDDRFAALFLDRRSKKVLDVLPRHRAGRRAIERHEVAGLATFPLCRHAYLDRALLRGLADGAEQVLVLGAGYDSRAYRFADAIADRPVFEVDLPAMSRAKARVVEAWRDVFGPMHVHRIEVDFQADPLAERLRAGGLRAGAATFVVWEGVSMYLPEAAVTATLDALAQVCGPGSRLGMDLWDGGGPGVPGAVRRAAAQTFRLIGEPVRFGVPVDEARALLSRHGWTVTDVADAPVLNGYATDGRTVERSLYVVTAERARR